MNAISDLIASLDGLQVSGGCDHCDAYQILQAHAFGEQNIHIIHVYHDDDCPLFAAISA